MTPLEKKLQDMGPIREDGSDKFFGMENPSVCHTATLVLFPFADLVLLIVRQHLVGRSAPFLARDHD